MELIMGTVTHQEIHKDDGDWQHEQYEQNIRQHR